MNRKHSVLLLTCTLAVAAILSTGQTADTGTATDRASAATQPTPAENPHWQADRCTTCHDATNEQGNFQTIPRDRIDALCLQCHDGVRASLEVHPVGRLAEGEQIVHPQGWPAPDNRLACVTCHDILLACDRDRQRPRRNPAFLREYYGGHMVTFCSRCHIEDQSHYQFNPHLMVSDDGEVLRQSCYFCHEHQPDLHNRRHRTGDSMLRRDDVALCGGCHMQHLEYFKPGHIGLPVPDQMKAYMVASEHVYAPGQRSDAATSDTDDTVGNGPAADTNNNSSVTTDELHPRWLPLHNNQIMVCSTCHNPHQAGLFDADTPLGRGALPITARKGPPAFRGFGKELCRACHPN